MTNIGSVDGVLYCYGGCGRRYEDFGLDVLLPTPLWNQIAVGSPFLDDTIDPVDREGRGGVLCAQCIVNRLALLQGVTAAFVDTTDRRTEAGLDELRDALADYDVAADKFIAKVESGRARSRETYADLKACRAWGKR